MRKQVSKRLILVDESHHIAHLHGDIAFRVGCTSHTNGFFGDRKTGFWLEGHLLLLFFQAFGLLFVAFILTDGATTTREGLPAGSLSVLTLQPLFVEKER